MTDTPLATAKGPGFTAVQGIIRRRILLNYAADPAVVQPLLPAPFRPKLYAGKAVVGICLIRLENVRPRWLPLPVGISSENAAHRIAIEWTDQSGEPREGVYIPRRDTDSCLNHLAGGRIFPGEHHLARFSVDDSADQITFKMDSQDKSACLDLKVSTTDRFQAGSIFDSVAEASRFFEGGCDGFSPRGEKPGLDGLRLCIGQWSVAPLKVEHARSAFYDDHAIFPQGTIRLDHALLMRDVAHEWENLNADGRIGEN